MMEAIYVLLGAIIGLAGSILGSYMQNKKQDELFNQTLEKEKIQYNNELKLSLINDLVDNSLFFYPSLNSQYELTFYTKFQKVPMFFESATVLEDYEIVRSGLINGGSGDNLRNVKYTYDVMVKKMCDEVGISYPNLRINN